MTTFAERLIILVAIFLADVHTLATIDTLHQLIFRIPYFPRVLGDLAPHGRE